MKVSEALGGGGSLSHEEVALANGIRIFIKEATESHWLYGYINTQQDVSPMYELGHGMHQMSNLLVHGLLGF